MKETPSISFKMKVSIKFYKLQPPTLHQIRLMGLITAFFAQFEKLKVVTNFMVSPSLKPSSPAVSASNSYKALHVGTFCTGELTLEGGRDGGREGGAGVPAWEGVEAGLPQGDADGVALLLPFRDLGRIFW